MIDNDNLYFLEGGSEMGKLLREKDWESTSMGPTTDWPQSLRTTLDIMLHSLFPMFLFWGDEYICFYNDAYRPSLGTNGKHPFILGQGAQEAWPEIWDEIGPLLNQVLTTGEAVWSENRLLPIFRNGKIEDVYWTFCYSAVRNGAGKPAGVLTVCTETTEAVRATEKAMKFRFMADKSSDPFILMCEDGSFEYLNPAALKKWGYTEDEAKSLKVPNVDPMYDQKSFEALFASAQKTDLPVFETIHKSKDGKEFPVEVKVSGFSFNGAPHMLGIARDISERQKAESDLKESEYRFRELADQSPMWIWITDEEVNVEYANRVLLEYIGIEKVSDFTGQVWEDIVHPKDIGIVYEGFGQAVEKCTSFSLDYRVRKASTGIYEWFTVKGVPRFEGKKLTGFIGTGMNVHRQKTFSEQLRKEVRLRTKELADTNVKLEKSNKELQSFAYISSHDLQEPLRKIQTFCSLLLANEYERLSERGKNQFDRMQSAAKRMQVLINDLLAYSRLEMEDRKFETMNLNQIFDKVREDLADEIKQKGATVEIGNSCEIAVVNFQFRQLLFNLVSNSLKYSSDDRPPIIKVDGHLIDAANIPHEGLEAKKYVRIRISDNGIGFDKAYSEKIFEVFQRLHGREKYRGTGVGLAIVKKIAENHKGFVTAKGEPGVGAVFEIHIPYNQNP